MISLAMNILKKNITESAKAVKPEDTQNPESAKTTRKAKAMQAEKEGRREAEKTTEAAKQVAMTGATYSKSETEEDSTRKISEAHSARATRVVGAMTRSLEDELNEMTDQNTQ